MVETVWSRCRWRWIALALAVVGLFGSLPGRAMAADGDKLTNGTYESPSYDFGISWDRTVWSAEESDNGKGTEGAWFDSGISLVYIVVKPETADDDATCVDAMVGLWMDDYPDGEVAPSRYDRPENPLGGAAELVTATFVSGDGLKSDLLVYWSCTMLPSGDATLLVFGQTYEDSYDSQLPYWNDLLGGVSLGGAEAPGDAPDDAPSDPSGGEIETYTSDDGYEVDYDADQWTLEVDDGVVDFTGEKLGIKLIPTDVVDDVDVCVQYFVDMWADRPDQATIETVESTVERPELAPGAAGDLYAVKLGDTNQRFAFYVECRELPTGEFLSIMVTASMTGYRQALPTIQALLDGIRIDGGEERPSHPPLGRQEA